MRPRMWTGSRDTHEKHAHSLIHSRKCSPVVFTSHRKSPNFRDKHRLLLTLYTLHKQQENNGLLIHVQRGGKSTTFRTVDDRLPWDILVDWGKRSARETVFTRARSPRESLRAVRGRRRYTREKERARASGNEGFFRVLVNPYHGKWLRESVSVSEWVSTYESYDDFTCDERKWKSVEIGMIHCLK